MSDLLAGLARHPSILAGLDPGLVEGWCRVIAARNFKREIKQHGAPYLNRYYLAAADPIRRTAPALFLHQFLSSDRMGELHSHPWLWGVSVILVGGYREDRCTGDGVVEVREYGPGDVNVIRAADRHRVDLVDGRECWTLFLAGPYDRPWGFYPGCEGTA